MYRRRRNRKQWDEMKASQVEMNVRRDVEWGGSEC